MTEQVLGGVVRQVAARLAAQSQHHLSDRQLLERFLHQHDEAAFAALVRRHERLVYAALARVLSDPLDLEDAFQATFLVLVRRASSVRWQEELGTWLYAVAHRVAVTARREARARLRHEKQARPSGNAAGADLSCREACEIVHEELDRLPEALRLPLLLCCLEGKSREEAAEQLGVSTNTVKGRLERGRNLLRRRLLRRGVPLTAALLAALTHSPARASAAELVQATLAAVCGPSARVAALANGVSATMILSQFKFHLSLLFLVGLLAVLGSRLGAERPAVADAKEAKRPAAAADGKEFEVAGRVLDDAGKPIAGAKLTLASGKEKARDAGVSGKDGRFRVRFTRRDLDRATLLIARAKGLGADWVGLSERGGEVTLRLGPTVPIVGRVVDLEGQPVAGAVVTMRWISKHGSGDLTPYLDLMARPPIAPPATPAGGRPAVAGTVGTPLLSVTAEALGLATSRTTDKAGRFRLEGIARERLVRLDVAAAGMVLKSPAVVTRAGFKKTRLFVGPTFDLPLAPGKAIVGVVKEKGTGRPVAGAEVSVGGERITAHNPTRTDERGAFRIDGLRKRPLYHVYARAADHFLARRDVEDTPGRDPVRVEFEVQRGIVIEGRILDGATGKPVAGVVQYQSRADNPALKRFTLSPAQGVGTTNARAGADGRFRVLTIPGPGYLAVRANENRFTRIVPAGWSGDALPTAPGRLQPHYFHATLPINVDEKKPASRKIDVRLDPGRSITLGSVDPDGKALRGVLVFGLSAIPEFSPPRPPGSARGDESAFRQKGSTFRASGLDPKQPRHLVFLHPQKKLGKVVLVRGDEKAPLVVRLESLGAVTGRVLSAEGKPAEGRLIIPGPPRLAFFRDYPVDLLDTTRRGRQPSSGVAWLPEPTRTDNEGRFRVEGLIPGLKYTLTAQRQDRGPDGLLPRHAVENVTVEPGKTRDVGDLPRVKRP